MPSIVYSTANIASASIARALQENFSLPKVQFIQTDKHILEIPCDMQTDLIIVPSTHKSQSSMRTLTVHAPGNWCKADFGGKEKTLNFVHASKMKEILCSMNRQVKEKKLDWNVSLEVDHHGPTCASPILFAEIGSTEKEWRDEEAAQIVAQAIWDALAHTKKCKCALGIGGGHYAPLFSKYELEKEELAMGHMLPKYRVDEVEYETFLQGVEKTVEKTEYAIIDWKGLDSKQREKMILFCERAGLNYEKKK